MAEAKLGASFASCTTKDCSGGTRAKLAIPHIRMARAAGTAQRISTGPAWDVQPRFSPDGREIAFTSDRGGRPQIYRVPAAGGSASRVTFEGTYNATATVSFDGKKIAVVQGAGNNYRIALMDSSLGSARWSSLSPGSLDESPSFAPNASMVLYAAREGGRGVLYAVSADARVRQRLVLTGGDVREPAWGPYRAQAAQ